MQVERHSKRDAVKFDRQWRAALRNAPRLRRRFNSSDLPVWSEWARVGLLFAHDGGTSSGTIRFEDGEAIPLPSELCEELGLDAVWFFADGYRWAVHAEHEDVDLAEVFEESPGTDS